MDDDQKLRLLIGAGIMYVSIHPRSEEEIIAYINKRSTKLHGSSELVSKALLRLKELKYIDDVMYAKRFIESRNRTRPKGKRLIQLELRKKGVSQDVIDLVDAELVGEDVPSDFDLGLAIAQKKYSLWQKLPHLEQKKKLFGFLQRRGFSSSVTLRVIDVVMGKRVQ